MLIWMFISLISQPRVRKVFALASPHHPLPGLTDRISILSLSVAEVTDFNGFLPSEDREVDLNSRPLLC